MTPAVVLDHLIIAAATLEQGCDYVASGLGVRPQPGGKHVAMGTHNALLRLGPRTYLEVIAIDPAGVAPARPRWFDLDDVRMRAALAEGPRLVHFVARTDDIEALARNPKIDPGPVRPGGTHGELLALGKSRVMSQVAGIRFSMAASFGAHWNESEFSFARQVTMKSSDSPRRSAIAGTNVSTD